MNQTVIECRRFSVPLREPYTLSFGFVAAFDTILICVRGPNGDGLGEITPLPGYSDETVESAEAALRQVARRVADGATLATAIAPLASTDPMTASALHCAVETAEEGLDAAFGAALGAPAPVVGLCGGATREAAALAARRLCGQGYRVLKVKVGGGDIAADTARLTAIAEAAGPSVSLRFDANQALSPPEAAVLCDAAAEMPVELIEQPFRPESWDAFAALSARSTVPLMLDESIWTEADIDRAAASGARAVKLKLCKHPGAAASLRLIAHARALGLDVVFGNGVQGAVGNHLEIGVHAKAGLETAGEFNGVLKMSEDPFEGDFELIDGRLRGGGLKSVHQALERSSPFLRFYCKLGAPEEGPHAQLKDY